MDCGRSGMHNMIAVHHRAAGLVQVLHTQRAWCMLQAPQDMPWLPLLHGAVVPLPIDYPTHLLGWVDVHDEQARQRASCQGRAQAGAQAGQLVRPGAVSRECAWWQQHQDMGGYI